MSFRFLGFPRITIDLRCFRWFRRLVAALTVLVLLFPLTGAFGQEKDAPIPGIQAYTSGHADIENPPDLLGGPIRVTARQREGTTYFVLPGPRRLDPSVFGTPEHPVGFDPAPFPMLGIPLDKRLSYNGNYTITDAATPFSDWAESGTGSLKMTLKDETAIDGVNTKDEIDFTATFKAPDGTEFRVTCNKPIPHGVIYPVFGGVLTNHMLHGEIGIGTRLMPTEYTFADFWGLGDVYREDKKIAEGQIVHVMITEFVRGQGYRLDFDGEVGHPPGGKTLHLLVPPYKPGKNGLEEAPLMTGFMPFPFIAKHMKKAQEDIQAMKEGPEKDARMATMKETMRIMQETRQSMEAAKKAGKMDGQPFFHVMFNDFRVTAGRGEGWF